MVASEAEAEVVGLFNNEQTAALLYITLNKIGFSQPPTPIKTYNPAAEVIVTTTVRQKGPRQRICDFIGLRKGLKKDILVY